MYAHSWPVSASCENPSYGGGRSSGGGELGGDGSSAAMDSRGAQTRAIKRATTRECVGKSCKVSASIERLPARRLERQSQQLHAEGFVGLEPSLVQLLRLPIQVLYGDGLV